MYTALLVVTQLEKHADIIYHLVAKTKLSECRGTNTNLNLNRKTRPQYL